LDMTTGVTNYAGETAINFENVYTGAGDDIITGTADANVINTGAGNDSINAGAGDDFVRGGDGNDTINGQNGNDRLLGGNGNDVIDGGLGLDEMDGGAGIDTLDVRFWSGDYHLNMTTGVTNYAGETAVNFERVYTGAGNDNIIGTAIANYISTGSGNDRIEAGAGNDVVNAGVGDDRVLGDTGNDRISGGAGNDRVSGGAGNDRISGGTGNDRLVGGLGNDTLLGGTGNDVINGNLGLDVMDGGAGIDTLDVRFWNNGYHLNMITGNTNYAGETATNFERVYTGAGADRIVGTSGANHINTSAGHDRVWAQAGNDVVIAGAGNDLVYGQAGRDRLIGATGNDTLVGGAGNDFINGSNFAAQGNGERDILTSGSRSDRDRFILGERSNGAGRIYYNNAGNADHAVITDFDRHNFVGDVSDRIQLLGSAASYSIANTNVGGVAGAGIYAGNDLIAIVQGETAATMNLNSGLQFTYV
ncbi:MAG: calcium-binding protein, partial [Cyanobacteria bacterium P01_F01_bin.150]